MSAPTATALHSCPFCSRHPSTHAPTGDDRCGACGLGDEREGDRDTTCDACVGIGRVRVTQEDGARRASDPFRKCLDCNGTGAVPDGA